MKNGKTNNLINKRIFLWIFSIILLASFVTADTIENAGSTTYEQRLRNGHDTSVLNVQAIGQSFNINGTGNYTLESIATGTIYLGTSEAGKTVKLEVFNDDGTNEPGTTSYGSTTIAHTSFPTSCGTRTEFDIPDVELTHGTT